MKDNRSFQELWADLMNSMKNNRKKVLWWIFIVVLTLLSALSDFLGWIDNISKAVKIPWLPQATPYFYFFIWLSFLLIFGYMVICYYKEKAALRNALDYIRSSNRHLVIHLDKLEKDMARKSIAFLKDQKIVISNSIKCIESASELNSLAKEINEMIIRRSETFQKDTVTHSKIFLKDIFLDIKQLFHSSMSIQFKLTLKLMYNEIAEETKLKELKYWNAFVDDEHERDRTGDLFPITDEMFSLLNSNCSKFKPIYHEGKIKTILIPLRAEYIDHLLYRRNKRIAPYKNFGFLECELLDFDDLNQDNVKNLVIPALLAISETIVYYIEDCLQDANTFKDTCYMNFSEFFSGYSSDDVLSDEVIDLMMFRNFYNGEGDDEDVIEGTDSAQKN